MEVTEEKNGLSGLCSSYSVHMLGYVTNDPLQRDYVSSRRQIYTLQSVCVFFLLCYCSLFVSYLATLSVNQTIYIYIYIHVIIIQFNSKLNSPEANYKVSKGKKMGRVRNKKVSENNVLIKVKIIKYKMTMNTLLLLLITTT
jgi:hypothetical protein